MRKLITVTLAIVLVLGMIGTASAATDPNTLVVGTPAMNGDFIPGFGNSSYDLAIKRILHYYTSIIAFTPGDEMVINETVVESYSVDEDEAGNKTYTWKIHEDLFWSDGSPITAKDYVFYLLFFSSPAWVEAGAASGDAGYGLVGYSDYNKGVADVFPGVKLVDEYSFSMTIDAAELPYFYELAYTNSYCFPMAVYAPGMEIVSDENGSKLVGKDVDQTGIEAEREALIAEIEAAKAEAEEANALLEEGEEPVRVSEVIKDANYQALLADLQVVAQTERFAPTVVSGPYKFVSFENQTVTLEINEYFKGDYLGQKPTIQYIEQRHVPQDMPSDILIAGDIDLLPHVVVGAQIEAAKAADNVYTHSYMRNGYGMISMHCDWGVTADPNVRWGLAYLIDRNAVIDYVLGGYGGIVHCEYGYAQWMYEEAGAELEELLTPFNLNIDKANEHLDMTEWKFEADGVTPFDPAKANEEGTYMRHNEKGEPLVVRHLGSTENDVTDIIEIQYVANAPLAGVKFEVTRGDFNALLDNYYYGYELGEDRYYNTFNLASGFGQPYDPYFSSWHSDFAGSWENSCQLVDEELDSYIMAMRSLDPSQRDEFVDIWLKYQKRMQDLLPQIPLYSNEYFDLVSNAIGNYNVTSFSSWDYLVCEITKDAQ